LLKGSFYRVFMLKRKERKVKRKIEEKIEKGKRKAK
jgi:hypothetical protein